VSLPLDPVGCRIALALAVRDLTIAQRVALQRRLVELVERAESGPEERECQWSGASRRAARALSPRHSRAIVARMLSTTTVDVRGRREALNVSQLCLAVRSGVSMAWIQAIEAGMQPVGSKALARVERVLDQLEHDHRDAV
jgi:hypothetical protein